jgi:hypothetical protein
MLLEVSEGLRTAKECWQHCFCGGGLFKILVGVMDGYGAAGRCWQHCFVSGEEGQLEYLSEPEQWSNNIVDIMLRFS